MKILSFVLSLHLAFITVLGGLMPVTQTDYTENYETLTSPLFGGADPWFYFHDGTYYYCHSAWNGVCVRSAESISELVNAESRVVYRAPDSTEYSCNYWAPELHFLNGAWYIYVAADGGRNEDHRMFVLRCDEPMGDYEMCGKITDPTDKWAIDGTILEKDNELYFIWSGWEGDVDGKQSLYIAHMSDPTHIDSERYLISEPKLLWEKKAMPINEGPVILKKNSDIFLFYSASGSWTDDYCLGMLKLCGDDPLNADSWSKCLLPVFKKTKTVFGPGHCSFVTSPDGSEDYIVYHATSNSGSGWNDRSVRIQRIKFVMDIPVLGKPIENSVKIDIKVDNK